MIPEIPYDVNIVAEAVRERSRRGRYFSIIAVSEGAMSLEMAKVKKQLESKVESAKTAKAQERAEQALLEFESSRAGHTLQLSRSRRTHRPGIAAHDSGACAARRHAIAGGSRVATRLGTAAAEYIANGVFGVLVAAPARLEAVPLKDVVGKRKTVPLDHAWVKTARELGLCLGD